MNDNFNNNCFTLNSPLSSYLKCEFIGRETTKKINSDEMFFVGKGENATVWRYLDGNEEKALKLFFKDKELYRLKYNVYLRMKNLFLERIVKALEIFDIFKENEDESVIDSYSMKYLKSSNILLSDLSISQLLENVYILEHDAQVLADNKIMMHDIKIDNSIIEENSKLYLTDIDMFKVCDNLKTDSIYKENRGTILYLLKEYFIRNIKNMHFNDTKENYLVSMMRYSFTTYFLYEKGMPITDILEKTFQGYETPKQYFLERVN